jgi:hypothetical protein
VDPNRPDLRVFWDLRGRSARQGLFWGQRVREKDLTELQDLDIPRAEVKKDVGHTRLLEMPYCCGAAVPGNRELFFSGNHYEPDLG